MRIGGYFASLLLMCYATVCSSEQADRYPNVTLEGTETPEVTQVNNLFIYNWPEEELARYPSPGAVKALEYCFQKTVVDRSPVFTLLFLEEVSKGFSVTHTINVEAEDDGRCTNRGGVETCCETKMLEPPSWLHLPSQSRAFGIFSKGRNRILGYNLQQKELTEGYQLPVDRMDDGLIRVPRNDTAPIRYRMMNLVIEAVSYTELTQLNRTELTLSPFTDDLIPGSTKQPPLKQLSTVVVVEIALGCFVISLFFVTLGVWMYLCHKAKALRRARLIHQQEMNHPIYEHVSKIISDSDGPLPELLSFYRNPAYALQRSQSVPEAKSVAKTGRPKLHHQWML